MREQIPGLIQLPDSWPSAQPKLQKAGLTGGWQHPIFMAFAIDLYINAHAREIYIALRSISTWASGTRSGPCQVSPLSIHGALQFLVGLTML